MQASKQASKNSQARVKIRIQFFFQNHPNLISVSPNTRLCEVLNIPALDDTTGRDFRGFDKQASLLGPISNPKSSGGQKS